MAPAKAMAPFAKDERVLCFHHEMLYEAKVLDSRATDAGSWQYKIHYKGWKNTWDDWVPQDRVRKFTEENKQLAAQLHEQMKALQGKPAPSASKSAKKGRANGSDFSSARGSEERGSMAAQGGGRAPRRLRDYDLEQHATTPLCGESASSWRPPLGQYASGSGFPGVVYFQQVRLYPSTPFRQLRGTLWKGGLFTTRQIAQSNFENSNKAKLELQHNNPRQLSIISDAKQEKSAKMITRSNKRSNPFAEGMEDAQPAHDPVAKRLAALAVPPEEVPEVPEHIANHVPMNPALMAYLMDPTQHPTDFLCKLPPRPDYQYLTKSGRVKPSITLPDPPATPDLKRMRNPIIPNEPATTHGTDSDGSSSDSNNNNKDPQGPKERATRARKAIKRIHNGSIAIPDERPCRRATFTRCFATRHLDYFLTRVNIQEDGFLDRPAISLPVPDRIKAILVDDWENVTKNQQLVPLPAAHPVENILKDYEDDELPKRTPGSPEASILEEMLAGLREYFDKCLGRILLYRFERAQYLEMIQLWEAPTGDMSGKNANQTYGAEHLCRLLVSLPELIAQTNMDQQSVSHLREEIIKLTNWMCKKSNLEKYFVAEYETPNQSYIDMARGN
ncbi:hypothetical protein V492_04545 [Pseudogymnoascus sp. VKM F-4246]|nr:hypothetical protein V492_04545 [Pseudogymnoascus sp. VKM F-4246]